jgi:hypothetical protein
MTQVRIEELDQDDNEVGEDTAPGEASEEAINRANPCPVVVDHVPAISVAGHRMRDSTLAVASQQSSTVMEDIWREDFAPNDEDYGPVVDQLPTAEAQTPSVKLSDRYRHWLYKESLRKRKTLTMKTLVNAEVE